MVQPGQNIGKEIMIKIGNTVYGDIDPIKTSFTGRLIRPNGTTFWYQDGKLHREDGPAITKPNGYKVWYQNDERHRDDGPAVILPGGKKVWWKNGEIKATVGYEPS